MAEVFRRELGLNFRSWKEKAYVQRGRVVGIGGHREMGFLYLCVQADNTEDMTKMINLQVSLFGSMVGVIGGTGFTCLIWQTHVDRMHPRSTLGADVGPACK